LPRARTMARQTLHVLFQTLAEEAGIPEGKRHPHVLKHSVASHLIAENTNLAIVQRALGHLSISSTMIYVGVKDSQVTTEVNGALLRAFGQ
jgi:site-specific recombinase XerD